MRRLLVALIVLLPTLAPAQIISGGPFSSGYVPLGGGTMSGPLLLPDGTEAAPSLAFSAQPGTGLYRIQSNFIAFPVTNSVGAAKFVVPSTGALAFTSGAAVNNSQDVQVARRAAGTPVVSLGGSTFSAATNSATLGGVFCVNTTSAATTGTTEQILATCTLPANALSANGKGVRITARGITAANANSKTFRVRIGGLAGTLLGGITTTASNTAWWVNGDVIRTGASAQAIGALAVVGTVTGTNSATSAVAETGTIDIVVTGQTPTAAGDLTFHALIVEFFN